MEFVKRFTQVGFTDFSILPEKTRKSRHSWEKIKLLDVLLIYFEQSVSLFANFYSNAKALQLFCEKSSLENFTRAQKYFTQVPQIPCLKQIGEDWSRPL